MESFVLVERLLWGASLIAEALLILHLFSQRLIRRYPFFSAYLATELLAGSLLIHLQVHGRTYAERFSIYTFVILIVRVGVAAELYERICEHFPGIGKFRFGLAAVLIVIAATIAVNAFRPDLAGQWVFPHTFAMMVRRFQGEIFAAVFLFMWIFFRYILSVHQPFRPNVLSHWRIATLYFATSGLASLALLASGGGSAVHPINSAMLAADIACSVAWIRSMHRTGEQVPWFQRLSAGEIKTVERQTQALLGTVRSLPRAISDELAEN